MEGAESSPSLTGAKQVPDSPTSSPLGAVLVRWLEEAVFNPLRLTGRHVTLEEQEEVIRLLIQLQGRAAEFGTDQLFWDATRQAMVSRLAVSDTDARALTDFLEEASVRRAFPGRTVLLPRDRRVAASARPQAEEAQAAASVVPTSGRTPSAFFQPIHPPQQRWVRRLARGSILAFLAVVLSFGLFREEELDLSPTPTVAPELATNPPEKPTGIVEKWIFETVKEDQTVARGSAPAHPSRFLTWRHLDFFGAGLALAALVMACAFTAHLRLRRIECTATDRNREGDTAALDKLKGLQRTQAGRGEQLFVWPDACPFSGAVLDDLAVGLQVQGTDSDADRLDVPRTIAKTLESGDVFSPVAAQQHRAHPTVVLLDVQLSNRRWLDPFEATLSRLRGEGIHFEIFEFRAVPGHLSPLTGGEMQPLERALRPFIGSPLLIFSEHLDFVGEFLPGEWQQTLDWLDANWPLRAWIDPSPRRQSGRADDALGGSSPASLAGMTRIPFSENGMRALARGLIRGSLAGLEVAPEPMAFSEDGAKRAAELLACILWACSAALVPGPLWGQLEEFRQQVPRLRSVLTSHRHLDLMTGFLSIWIGTEVFREDRLVLPDAWEEVFLALAYGLPVTEEKKSLTQRAQRLAWSGWEALRPGRTAPASVTPETVQQFLREQVSSQDLHRFRLDVLQVLKQQLRRARKGLRTELFKKRWELRLGYYEALEKEDVEERSLAMAKLDAEYAESGLRSEWQRLSKPMLALKPEEGGITAEKARELTRARGELRTIGWAELLDRWTGPAVLLYATLFVLAWYLLGGALLTSSVSLAEWWFYPKGPPVERWHYPRERGVSLNSVLRWEATQLRPALRQIQPGTFVMGSPEEEDGRDSDETQHKVRITRAFAMAETEVTQAQYEAVMGKPFEWSGCSNPVDVKEQALRGDDLPVICVSWREAVRYANELSMKETRTPCYQIEGESTTWQDRDSCTGYRLPTEAEWEYSARAGTENRYSGTDDADRVCDFGNVADETAKKRFGDWSIFSCEDHTTLLAKVGTYRSNGFGLFDMSGNVWEWTWDWYQSAYEKDLERDPSGPSSGDSRVVRGGSWDYYPQSVRVANRIRGFPSGRFVFLGFRVSRSLP